MTTRARIAVPAARAFVVVFGVMALWLARDGLNADGVAYLDASDEFLAGRWPASGTGYWSPLYPTLLALGRLVGGTAPVRELAIAQAVNLIIFLLAFAALEVFMRSVRAVAITREGAEPNDTTWRVLVYALFAVGTVGWIRVWLLTPDMLVAAIVFATGAVCLRLASGTGRWGTAAVLGALLGLGYLAKAALLPVGVVVLATLAFVVRRRSGIRLIAAATAVFVAVASPQIEYASRLRGTLTFSDVGRLSHLWFIAGVPGPVSSAFPLPSRLPSPSGQGQSLAVLDRDRDAHPAIYDIDAPIPGTLPIWYDAGYWYRGVVAPLRPLAIARALVRHARVFLEMLGFLLVGGVAAAVAGPMSRRALGALRPEPVLVVPAFAALAMYALVLVQTRYVAPFALLLFAGLVPPWAIDDLSRRLRAGFATGALVALPLVAHQVRVDTTYWRSSARARANLVLALAARGVTPGTHVGFIGDAYDALWAREARLRFVSLVPRAEAARFWELDAPARARVLAQMRDQGAGAVIAETPAPGVATDGWEPLPTAGVPKADLVVYRELR